MELHLVYVLLSVIAINHTDMSHVDVKTAFLEAKIRRKDLAIQASSATQGYRRLEDRRRHQHPSRGHSTTLLKPVWLEVSRSQLVQEGVHDDY